MHASEESNTVIVPAKPPILAAGDQNQVVASRRQLAREDRSQAGGRPCDRSDTVAMARLLYDPAMTVMRQTWNDVSFLHWRYDPAVVRPLLPRGLELDVCDGAAWVGLVPFYISGLRPLSDFPETNVRTYATDRTGKSGVWFFSLDAARLLAVVGARAGYALPYFWARMRVTCDGATAT
jgi:uncharacterized protein YqjF (DUF2071 family)